MERVHKTVKTMLICKYLENKQKFNLDNGLKIVVDVYNDTKHRTTLYNLMKFFIVWMKKYWRKLKKIL